MKCPSCKTSDLKPTFIEEHLPAMGCAKCRGSLVSLLYYRYWVESQQQSQDNAHTAVTVKANDTINAITCPKCSRVMTKYKLTGGVMNRLDVCSVCDEAWLDRGEWELLHALRLSRKMPVIFTDEWQRRIRRELAEGTRRSILARAIGEEGLNRVEEFREWLSTIQNKSDVLAYLYRNDSSRSN